MLGLEAEGPVPRLVHSIEMVGGVQLDPRLRGMAGHPAARIWLEDLRRQLQPATPSVDDEIVVVALRAPDVANPLANAVEAAEIEGRACHGSNFARGNERGIRRGVVLGVDLKFVSQDIPIARAGQVEIGVVRQVHHGGPVCLRPVGDEQLILVIPRVRHSDVQITGIAFLTIDAAIAKLGDGSRSFYRGVGLPELRGESFPAAVDMIAPFVGGDAHLLALQREPRTVDPIGVAADDRRGRQPPLVGIHRVATEDDVGRLAGPIRHPDRRDCGPVLRDTHRGSGSVFQGVQADGTPIGHPAKVGADHRGRRRSARSGTAFPTSHPRLEGRRRQPSVGELRDATEKEHSWE